MAGAAAWQGGSWVPAEAAQLCSQIRGITLVQDPGSPWHLLPKAGSTHLPAITRLWGPTFPSTLLQPSNTFAPGS